MILPSRRGCRHPAPRPADPHPSIGWRRSTMRTLIAALVVAAAALALIPAQGEGQRDLVDGLARRDVARLAVGPAEGEVRGHVFQDHRSTTVLVGTSASTFFGPRRRFTISPTGSEHRGGSLFPRRGDGRLLADR